MSRLHELALALEELTPESVFVLPEGQKALILVRASDLFKNVLKMPACLPVMRFTRCYAKRWGNFWKRPI